MLSQLGEECDLMAPKNWPSEMGILPRVAKQHDVFACANTFSVFVSSCTMFRLDRNMLDTP